VTVAALIILLLALVLVMISYDTRPPRGGAV